MLVLAIGTVVIFSAILVHNWDTVTRNTPRVLRQVQLGLPLTALIWLLIRRRRGKRPAAAESGT